MTDFTRDIQPTITALRAGGVILYPTDTVWGLGCDATNEKAINKIFEIKKRSPSKSMIILVANAGMISEYVEHSSDKLIELLSEADSPTTGIFRNAQNLPGNLVNQDGSIAIRIASDDFCKAVISGFGKPIVSTSANISQQGSPQNFSEINPLLIQQADYTALYRRDDRTRKAPSHIIRLDEAGQIERLR